jgi:hypothetical protein
MSLNFIHFKRSADLSLGLLGRRLPDKIVHMLACRSRRCVSTNLGPFSKRSRAMSFSIAVLLVLLNAIILSIVRSYTEHDSILRDDLSVGLHAASQAGDVASRRVPEGRDRPMGVHRGCVSRLQVRLLMVMTGRGL